MKYRLNVTLVHTVVMTTKMKKDTRFFFYS